ncbi:MAG TPA: glycosyltransferase family 39 protein, partial [Acidimicrobiales bacterium]|nr:glycosyltransferase family 39 protein [Acidimicrobiales bacterium]
QLFFACAIGAAAVFCTGLAAREVGGRRVGLVAAVVAAVYPNYWINEFLGLSETLVLLLVALVILAAVRLWRRPGLAGAAGLGLLCGLAADTRAEQVLLVPLVLAPILLLHRALDWRRRIGYLALGGAAAVLVITPWIGFNLSRFTHHVYFSTDEGQTLAMANCRPTYYGNFIGSDDFYCIDKIAVPRGDESVRNARYAKVAKAYMSEHTLRLPVVMLARVGREFAFYAPLGNIHQESVINDRPESLAWVGLGMYYVLLAGSVYGVVVLRRRGMTVVPYAGILLELVITAAVTFGETRYRAPFEVVLVVLGAVAADDLWSRWRSRTGSAPVTVIEDQRPSVLSVP